MLNSVEASITKGTAMKASTTTGTSNLFIFAAINNFADGMLVCSGLVHMSLACPISYNGYIKFSRKYMTHKYRENK